jgi:hypothetical protein
MSYSAGCHACLVHRRVTHPFGLHLLLGDAPLLARILTFALACVVVAALLVLLRRRTGGRRWKASDGRRAPRREVIAVRILGNLLPLALFALAVFLFQGVSW